MSTETELKLWHWYVADDEDGFRLSLVMGRGDNEVYCVTPPALIAAVVPKNLIGPIAGPGSPPPSPRDREDAERIAAAWAGRDDDEAQHALEVLETCNVEVLPDLLDGLDEAEHARQHEASRHAIAAGLRAAKRFVSERDKAREGARLSEEALSATGAALGIALEWDDGYSIECVRNFARERDEARRSLAAMTHAARHAAGVSLRDAAALIGVSAVDLGKHERGKEMLSHEQLTPLMDIANARALAGRVAKIERERDEALVRIVELERADPEQVDMFADPNEPQDPEDGFKVARFMVYQAETIERLTAERDEWKRCYEQARGGFGRGLGAAADLLAKCGDIDISPAHREPPEDHVRVRIAVAVAPDSTWSCYGCEADDDAGRTGGALAGMVDTTGRPGITFVEADVPLPREPETVRGEVAS